MTGVDDQSRIVNSVLNVTTLEAESRSACHVLVSRLPHRGDE
jgi:hypothetical protein